MKATETRLQYITGVYNIIWGLNMGRQHLENGGWQCCSKDEKTVGAIKWWLYPQGSPSFHLSLFLEPLGSADGAQGREVVQGELRSAAQRKEGAAGQQAGRHLTALLEEPGTQTQPRRVVKEGPGSAGYERMKWTR